ncbi:MAG: DEAD/DEAH box helicase [Ignavibacteria bacterium]|nr:DEAD/DEAH box helicase [Ignavibacteria bacterium]
MTDLTEIAKEIFSSTGAFSHQAGFEHRPQQEAMAGAIANALVIRQHLTVEAPTGVGKTLAYLVPAILYATSTGRKAIISTHTKTLQEQIFQKDIPVVRSSLRHEFTAVLLKGRKNYLCTTRLNNALSSTMQLFNREGVKQLQRIRDWSLKTTNGDIENLEFAPRPEIWDMVCSVKDACSSKLCGSGCFFQQVKERLKSAHLAIMNHALFFTLMARQETDARFIFDFDFVIFDEAQTVEAAAIASIGKNISRYEVLGAIHKLYNSKKRKGLLANQNKHLKSACKAAEHATVEFFDSIRRYALANTSRQNQFELAQIREIRIRTPHVVANILEEPLAHLQSLVRKVENSLHIENEKQELAVARRALWEAQTFISEFLEQLDGDLAYWVDLGGPSRESTILCSSPYDVAERVAPMLFRDDTSIIMTGATLSVNGILDYFHQRLGAHSSRGMILTSPFDYGRQMKLRIARDIPEPDTEGYATALPKWIMQSIDRSAGKALILFTNGSMMRDVASELADSFEEKGLKLLVQGGDQQRHKLLKEFREDVSSVLFGLDSFWMGVDVPGEALEHVVITRLPFAVPNHPLIEARIESIAKRGGNSFMEYTLPEAVLKLRQGVGRLVRSHHDKGMVTILDSRILTRRYGKLLISSLPQCPIEIITADGDVEHVLLEE